ncbi:MAG TPA: hypothetical protein VEK76_12625 [Candidatus Binatia bacterium]|nr:hypothetical protein [Candidatus Binatia bacterium]
MVTQRLPGPEITRRGRRHPSPPTGLSTAAKLARWAGGLAILAAGGVHLQEYVAGYSGIPTIGTLFLLNFVAATVIAVTLILPVAPGSRRAWPWITALAEAGGVAFAVTSLTFLLISQNTPLFGFREGGFIGGAILAAMVSEVASALLLGTALALRVPASHEEARLRP